MRNIQQFRFFGDNSPNNYPEGLDTNALVSGAIFNDYTPITQIGIQSLPGTIFYLNNSETCSNPIMLGYSGIYELNLEGIAEINTLCFNLASLATISQVRGASLIIDIVYEEAA